MDRQIGKKLCYLDKGGVSGGIIRCPTALGGLDFENLAHNSLRNHNIAEILEKSVLSLRDSMQSSNNSKKPSQNT